ncbi:MAG: MurR/RpiR family transcriptional regulator [Hungatella sp.]|nr:MurR/RpiR family transcriptional regulator [Hungatella sp.]
MNFIEKIESQKENLTNNEMAIYHYIMEDLNRLVSGDTIINFSRQCGVSKSAVLRFAQKMGYSGYPELKFDASRYVHSGKHQRKAESPSRIDDILDGYSRSISDIRASVSEDVILDMISGLISAKKVKLYGYSKSGLAARHMRYRLSKIEFDAEAVTDSFLMAEISHTAAPGEVHIFFSESGSTPFVVDSLCSAFERGASTILVTFNPSAKSRKYASHFVALPNTRLLLPDYFPDLQPVFQVFIELMVSYLSEKIAGEGQSQ